MLPWLQRHWRTGQLRSIDGGDGLRQRRRRRWQPVDGSYTNYDVHGATLCGKCSRKHNLWSVFRGTARGVRAGTLRTRALLRELREPRCWCKSVSHFQNNRTCRQIPSHGSPHFQQSTQFSSVSLLQTSLHWNSSSVHSRLPHQCNGITENIMPLPTRPLCCFRRYRP